MFYKNLLIFVFVILLVPTVFAYENAVIYYNEACSMCSEYIENELIPILNEDVNNIIKKDYINDNNNRIELNKLNEQYNIPTSLQGHFTTFIDDKIILEGHVPEHVIRDLFKENISILIYQDEMDHAKNYIAWGFKGEPKKYDINEPISTYLNWFDENKNSLKEYKEKSALLPLVLVSGFLDGINPCAFAVLLFFIAFLFTLQKSKGSIFKMGFVYILAIYLAYFLIGIGLMKTFLITNSPHLMAKIGSYLLLILGIINIKDYFFPKSPLHLKIPSFSKEILQKWIHKATLPAAFILGFLVGLCTFPCSGGIYVAVISLLNLKATYFQGLMYLVIYNIMFVMPLVIILLLASNKKTTEKLSQLERSKSKLVKLISGLLMIIIALIILIFFV